MTTIRRCRRTDIPDVLAFIDEHWKRGHILTVDRPLFEWQYARCGHPGEYNIMLARRDEDGALLGLLGYLPTARFDPALADDNAIWLALWKVRDDAGGPVGLSLLNEVVEHEPHTSIGVVGIQPAALAIYRALKFQVGTLQQYVLPNPDISDFHIASFGRPPIRPVADIGLSAVPLTESSFERETAGLALGGRDACAPRKTPAYFRARFLQHPIYRYRTFVLHMDDRRVGLLAARVATHDGRRALRIVDVVAPDEIVPGLGALALAEIRALGAEYADLHNAGIEPALFEAAGFSRVDPGGTDIVPDHFEPFDARNAPISFALKSSRRGIVFKGDGDQDRPNQRIAAA